MSHIVVTGGTRGIGHGLARAFLEAGARVTVASRSQPSVERAVEALAHDHGADKVRGQVCDVSRPDSIADLADAAERFAPVDVWVNNAGINVTPGPVRDTPSQELADLVGANLLGVVLGSREALRIMSPRKRGKIYNVEGFGADGLVLNGFATYGATKSAVRYFSRAIQAEAKAAGVIVATVDPGVVATDMLQKIAPALVGSRLERIMRVTTQQIPDVAPRLVAAMLANERSGAHLRSMGFLALFARLITAPFRPGAPLRELPAGDKRD